MNVDTDGLGSKPQEKIAHGVLAGVQLKVKPLIGNTMSEEEIKEYFSKGVEEIRKGFELIPGKLRIRVARAQIYPPNPNPLSPSLSNSLSKNKKHTHTCEPIS